MSKGYCGYADLIQEDASALLYSYCAYNLNLEQWRAMKHLEDGELQINKAALVEPEIHEIIRRMPSGRKQLQIKRITQYVSIDQLIEAGQIAVQNASGAWQTQEQGADIVAVSLLHRIFSEFQQQGQAPQHVGWFV